MSDENLPVQTKDDVDGECLTDCLRELDQIRRVLGCPMEEADILQSVKDLKERVAKQEEVIGARNAEIRDLKLQNGWDAEAALELTEIQEALDKVILAESLYEEDFSYPQIVQFLAGRARDFGFLLGEFLDGVNDGRVEKALAQSRGEISPNGEPSAAPASSVEEGGTPDLADRRGNCTEHRRNGCGWCHIAGACV